MGKRLPVTEQLRRLIKGSGLSRYKLSKLAKIDQSQMTRFMSGERGMSASALDRLGDVLDLEIISHRKATKG